MNNVIGLKDLRENVGKYITKIDKGESFLVIRKSKPVFKIVSPFVEENWETVVDFTKLNKNGVSASDVLRVIKKLNA